NHVQRQAHNEIALEREHHKDSEEECNQRERADPGNEARAVPLLALDPNKHKAGYKPGGERNAQVDCDALCDLGDADVDDASFKTEPLGEQSNENPGIEAVEEDLKNTVDGDESSDVVCVAIRQLIPDQNHRDTASDANQDKAAHVGRFTAKKNYRKDEHERWPNDPVLNQRQSQDPLVAENIAQFLVSNFRQRREHHDDQSDGDRNVGRPALKAIDEPGRAWDEVADPYSNCHCEKDP